MERVKALMLIVVFTQLGACAVMSKQQCMDANWREVGYTVAFDGAVSQNQAFELREAACAKHGKTANYKQFKQGFADGRVYHCQLINAVELGVKGRVGTIENRLCPERDYPGFYEAFDVGYKLNRLRNQASRSKQSISSLSSKIFSKRKRIERISHDINSGDFDKDFRERLLRERRRLRDDIVYAKREVRYLERMHDDDLAEARRHQNYVYNDYVYSLDDQHIDPRVNRRYERPEKQTEFEDRIDDILNR